ncbi:MAG: DUF5715 family protein [Longimicrobiales bacterium]|nr:DUF5715 family protein [Longimicrobiales bacterium]
MTRASSNPARIRLAAAATGALAVILVLALPTRSAAQTLKGSPASLDRQNRLAREHDFTFIRTAPRVQDFAERGWLVRIRPDSDVELHGVSYPYARPEVALFVSRLASQYRAACGERLVVTSLTRPTSSQPRNASDRSVHPTGMALDVRYSLSAICRRWIEDVLLRLEKSGVVEATRERRPPHYHIAVFPQQYRAYVDRVAPGNSVRVASASSRPAPSPAPEYKVRSGDSLWDIARTHGITVAEIRSANNLPNSRIFAGQVLEIPRGR